MHEPEPHQPEPSTPDNSLPADASADPVEQPLADGPRVYVASLSDYNNGILHGAWIDAAVKPAELDDGIAKMLETSPTTQHTGQPAEEWAIHDFENFGELRINEYDRPEWVTAVARGIKQHGPAFAAWVAHSRPELDALNHFEDAYLGEWDSVEDYAESFIDDLGTEEQLDKHFDSWLRPYVQVDYAAFARDLQAGGDITAVDKPSGGVWIFDNHA